MWRLVVHQVATLAELETTYSLMDLADANEALDLRFLVESPPSQERR